MELSPGLTVLTGETGAGKTMVVTGLRLLVGGRADASRVRSGAAQAVVEGRFVLDGVDTEVAGAARDVVVSAGGRMFYQCDLIPINLYIEFQHILCGRTYATVIIKEKLNENFIETWWQ